MTADDLVTILSAVGDSWPAAVVAVAGALAFVTYKALPYLKDIKGLLGEVRHEVQHNGGSSMKDSVGRTEQGLTELRALVVEHIKEARQDRERLDALERR